MLTSNWSKIAQLDALDANLAATNAINASVATNSGGKIVVGLELKVYCPPAAYRHFYLISYILATFRAYMYAFRHDTHTI